MQRDYFLIRCECIHSIKTGSFIWTKIDLQCYWSFSHSCWAIVLELSETYLGIGDSKNRDSFKKLDFSPPRIHPIKLDIILFDIILAYIYGLIIKEEVI